MTPVEVIGRAMAEMNGHSLVWDKERSLSVTDSSNSGRYDGYNAEAGYVLERLEKAGCKVAKAESPWVPIADIPEEWKDGRLVDLIINVSGEGSFRWADCKFIRDIWCRPIKGSFSQYCSIEISDEYGTTKVTHAMLPPPPPESEG